MGKTSTVKNEKKITEKTSSENETSKEEENILENEVKEEEKSDKDLVNNSNPTSVIPDENNRKKRIIIISIAVAVTLVIFLLFSTIFALLNINSKTIVSGISIKGIDVSGLTKEEAYEKLSNVCNKKLTTSFELMHNADYNITVVPTNLNANFDIETSINTAYNIGRENNIFKDNYNILFLKMFKLDITPSFTYDEQAFDNLVSEIQANLPDRLIEPNYYIDEDILVISKGVDGSVVDANTLKLNLIANINNFDKENENIAIPVVQEKAKNIDIDKIHSEIYSEPKDAYYTKEPFTVYPHKDGVDFAISVEEAKNIVSQNNSDTYEIPLVFTSPNVTTNKIGTEAFPNLLATYSTTYSTSNYNRSTNIRLASEKIDGTVVMPGEIFSYNTTVGKRTAEAGFKEAGVYLGGQVTTGIGGGICQVSSTLYNSVLLSNLEIVERYNHGFNPGYVPAGRDATVSWGGPDFKFKNTRNYPIRISASGTGGTIEIEIFGLLEANEYEVEIQSYVTSYIPYQTITRYSDNLESGETRVSESGSNGCKSVCYRILKQNGEEVSKTLLSTDTYSPHNRVVIVGTGDVSYSSEPDSEPTTPSQPAAEPATTPSESSTTTDSTPTSINVNDGISVTL